MNLLNVVPHDWRYETVGEWTFRYAPCNVREGGIAEARRGEFLTEAGLTEPADVDVHFTLAASPDEALRDLKRKVLS